MKWKKKQCIFILLYVWFVYIWYYAVGTGMSWTLKFEILCICCSFKKQKWFNCFQLFFLSVLNLNQPDGRWKVNVQSRLKIFYKYFNGCHKCIVFVMKILFMKNPLVPKHVPSFKIREDQTFVLLICCEMKMFLW